MQTPERTFLLRFSISARTSDEEADDEEEEDEERGWREWEERIKPELVKLVCERVRATPGWKAHVRNRGIPAEREIELVLERA